MRRLVAVLAIAATFAAFGSTPAHADPKVDHVLLLSLDGFHDFDLTNYVAAHPSSALAQLVSGGVALLERVGPDVHQPPLTHRRHRLQHPQIRGTRGQSQFP